MSNPNRELSYWLEMQAAGQGMSRPSGITRRKGTVTQASPLLVATGEGPGLPAVNISGVSLSAGDVVWLDVWDGHRQVVGQHKVGGGGGGPGGGWELVWQAQAAGNIFDPDVAQFDDWDSLRMVVLIRGSASGSMGQVLVELSGFGGMTPPTVSLADGEEASVTMEADRHMDGGWSARIHDIAPPGSVSGRAAATTIGAWQNFPSATITPVIFPSGGAGYVSARLYGLPHTEAS